MSVNLDGLRFIVLRTAANLATTFPFADPQVLRARYRLESASFRNRRLVTSGAESSCELKLSCRLSPESYSARLLYFVI